jgi:uncharacterized protein
MTRAFGDSFYFIALLNARDFCHAEAREVTMQLQGRTIVTTRWILAEVGNALSGLGARKSFTTFVEGLSTQRRVIVVKDSDTLYERGARLFASRWDKEWSLIDCISFEVMRHEGIDEVLSGDRHFTHAGFKLLMKG